MAEFGKGVALLAMSSILGLWSSFVALTLYGWFAVPLGAPSLGYWHTYGLLSLAAVAVIWAQMTPVTNDAPIAFSLAKAVVYGWFLLVGALAHVLMSI